MYTKKIQHMQNDRNTFEKEIGIVTSTKHYLVTVEGLPSVRIHDVVIHERGFRGIVTSLSHNGAEVMMLDQGEVKPGHHFELKAQSNQLSLGTHLFGRVISPLGDPIDDGSSFPERNTPMILDKEAGDLASRKEVVDQLETGFSVIDTILPIGVGQRQLLMGPVQSGTDAFTQRVIQNQKGKDFVCVYAGIGKTAMAIRRFADNIFSGEAKDYTVMVTSFSHDTAPLNTITALVGLQIAEYFCDNKKNVLLIIDDLYTHAKYLREISLLEGRLPGRDSYPGDIFYQQARLIERAGNFEGKGSITMLPVLQNDIEGDIDLITTNVMGTTDGHLSFSPVLFSQGKFPSVVPQESVTRVGKNTQTIVQKQLSTFITSLLSEAETQERFAQFGAQVSEHGAVLVSQAKIIRKLFSQKEIECLSKTTQAILFSLPIVLYWKNVSMEDFDKNNKKIQKELNEGSSFEDLHKSVHEEKNLNAFLEKVKNFKKEFDKICQK
jgi:F-type H+/Na+-transporting ATPase subunit alpha